MIVLILLFITAFEMSTGPVLWVYLAEIMQDKGMSIASTLLYFFMWLIAFSTPHFIKALGQGNEGYIFIFYGIITSFGTVFVYFFMKETRGKTSFEIENSYN